MTYVQGGLDIEFDISGFEVDCAGYFCLSTHWPDEDYNLE
jgi:hypothetical protein